MSSGMVLRAKTVAEGAGAASLAAARCRERATGNVVCVVSGGNIDAGAYAQVLAGAVPEARIHRSPDEAADRWRFDFVSFRRGWVGESCKSTPGRLSDD